MSAQCQRSWRRSCAASLAVALTAGCGWFGDDIEFYGLYEQSPGVLVVELRVCTDDDVTAVVVENAGEIRIDDVSATIQPGDDCNGVLLVDLDEPLRDRAVVVEGDRWVPYQGTCGRPVTLVPPDVPDWFVDCG